MDRLDAMKLFARLAETGSFSAVAREAGIGQRAASSQMAALESRLGLQLPRRSPRGLSLTGAGQNFYNGVVRLLRRRRAVSLLPSLPHWQRRSRLKNRERLAGR